MVKQQGMETRCKQYQLYKRTRVSMAPGDDDKDIINIYTHFHFQILPAIRVTLSHTWQPNLISALYSSSVSSTILISPYSLHLPCCRSSQSCRAHSCPLPSLRWDLIYLLCHVIPMRDDHKLVQRCEEVSILNSIVEVSEVDEVGEG